MAKIFISHAHKDSALVGVFTDFLERTVGVPATDIFCTSRSGQGIPPGVKFVEEIKRNLKDSQLVIGFITPNLYRSRFSLCELGATWALSKNFIPVVLPPLTKADIPDVMMGIQAVDLTLPDDVALLAHRLQEALDVDRESFGPRMILGVPEFIKQLRALSRPRPSAARVALAAAAGALVLGGAGVLAYGPWTPPWADASTPPLETIEPVNPRAGAEAPDTKAKAPEAPQAQETEARTVPPPPSQPVAAAAPTRTEPRAAAPEPQKAAPPAVTNECRNGKVRALGASEKGRLVDLPQGARAWVAPSFASVKALKSAELRPTAQAGDFEVRHTGEGRLWLLGFAAANAAAEAGKGAPVALYSKSQPEANRPLCVLIEQLRSVKPKGSNGRSFVELRVEGG